MFRGWKLESLTLPLLSSATERIAKKAVPRAQSVCSPQQSQETTAPEDIPPEAVKENMDVKDELVELAPPATGEPSGEKEEDGMESQQEESGLSLDPEMLSYLNKLFSQDNLINRVSWLRAPRSTRFRSLALQHPDLGSAQEDWMKFCSLFLSWVHAGVMGVSLCACVYVVCVVCAFSVYMWVCPCVCMCIYSSVCARLELMAMSSKTLTLYKRIGWSLLFYFSSRSCLYLLPSVPGGGGHSIPIHGTITFLGYAVGSRGSS